MTTQEIVQQIQSLENNPNSTFGEVVRTLRKCNDLYKDKKNSSLFWKSPLPKRFLNDFKKDNWLLELLLGYFENPQNQNLDFLRKISKDYFTILQKAIKLTRVFDREDWFNHLSDVLKNHSDSKPCIFFKEINFLKELNKKWEAKACIQKDILASISYEKLFEVATNKFEKFKQSPAVLANRNLLTEREMNLCYVLNNILNYKKDKQSNTNNTISDKEIADLIDFFYSHHAFITQVEKYCVGYANCEMIDEDCMEIRTNKDYTIHRKNEHKCRLQEMLAISKAMQNNPISEKNIQYIGEYEVKISLETNVQYFQYLKMPEKYTWQNGEVEIKKVFESLATMNKLADATIYIKEKEELIKILVSELKYNTSEIELMIDFLTTDLSEFKGKFDFLCKPFIKIDNQYFWLTNLLKNRKWSVLMYIRLSNERLYQINTPSDEIEIALSKKFDKNNFVVPQQFLDGMRKKEKQFSLADGRSSDMDIFAFKTGVLFLMEIKTTSLGEDLLGHAKYLSQTFEFKASQQLDYAKEYIEELDPKKFKEKFGFDKSEIKEIKTLIISNIFEQDDTIVNHKHLKISLFELLVILNKDLEDMLNIDMGFGGHKMPFHLYEKAQNGNDARFRQDAEEYFPKSFNLWSGKECSAKDLIDAINKNKIWDFLDKMYDFNVPEMIELTPFENFQKNWLS